MLECWLLNACSSVPGWSPSRDVRMCINGCLFICARVVTIQRCTYVYQWVLAHLCQGSHHPEVYVCAYNECLLICARVVTIQRCTYVYQWVLVHLCQGSHHPEVYVCAYNECLLICARVVTIQRCTYVYQWVLAHLCQGSHHPEVYICAYIECLLICARVVAIQRCTYVHIMRACSSMPGWSPSRAVCMCIQWVLAHLCQGGHHPEVYVCAYNECLLIYARVVTIQSCTYMHTMGACSSVPGWSPSTCVRMCVCA